MMQRIKQWMQEHWWGILAVAAAFTVVARTSTVGAPAEAHAPYVLESSASAQRLRATRSGSRAVEASMRALASMEKNGREQGATLRSEIDEIRTLLRQERGRSMLLEARYEELENQFTEVTNLTRGLLAGGVAEIEASATKPSDVDFGAPVPIEAIYVER